MGPLTWTQDVFVDSEKIPPRDFGTSVELCAFENLLFAVHAKGQSVVDKPLLLLLPLLTLSQGDVMPVEKKKKCKKTGAAEPDTAQLASQPPHN